MDDQPRVGARLDLTVSFHIDEIQEITSTGTAGVWHITVAGVRSRAIRWDATWRDVQDAVQHIPGMRGAQCWGGPMPNQPVRLRFPGKTEAPPVGVTDTGLTGDVTVTTVQDGGPIILDEEPTVTVTPAGDLADVEDLGGGVYRAVFVPDVAALHRWTAAGVSAAHGPVRATGAFTAR